MTELNDQYQYLSEKPENLNDLELELFLANSNFLTDHIEILRKLNNVSRPAITAVHENEAKPVNATVLEPAAPDEVTSGTEKPPVIPEKETARIEDQVAPVVEEVHPAETADAPIKSEAMTSVPEEPIEELMEAEPSKPVEISSSAENMVKEPAINLKPEAVPDVTATAEAAVNQESETVKEVVIPEKTISVEASAAPEEPAAKLTINEMISAQVNSGTVATRYTNRPVADLRSIINLNDKLLFIKDLFNGYSLAYSEAIELLNRFDNLEAADNFLKTNYAEKNRWSEKQSTADKLYEILNRRFAK